MNIIKKIIPESLKKQFRLFKYWIYATIAGFPEKKLKFIGVTGSSGKSTTASMIYHVLLENNVNVGVISTLGAKAGKKIMDTGLHVTSPDPKELQDTLKYMVNKGVEYVVLESSSHALAQGRFGSITFDYAVYTNIKRDHLDWHKTWENYAAAKAELIHTITPEGKIIINRADKDGYDFLSQYAKAQGKEEKIITYSNTELTDVLEAKDGIRFEYADHQYILPMIGTYNIDNALATINTALQFDLDHEGIADALKTFPGLEGRMEVIQEQPFLAIVNFAHNTDSLEKSLKTARRLIDGHNRVIAVFGSAGARDVEKRTTMGEVSGKLADITIVTAEDPRDESLYEINTKIIKGAEANGAKLIYRFSDTDSFEKYEIKEENIAKGQIYAFDEESVNSRYDAIEFAVAIARPGDLIIAEGKGHEQSLAFGNTEYPFTDQDAMRRALRRRGYLKSE